MPSDNNFDASKLEDEDEDLDEGLEDGEESDEDDQDDEPSDGSDTLADDESEQEGEDDESDEEDSVEKRRQANRLKRQKQKELRRNKVLENKLRLQDLTAKNEKLEQRLASMENYALRGEFEEVEGELNKGLRAIELSKSAMAKAEEEQDPIAFAKAQAALQQATNYTQQMRRAKEGMLQDAKQKSQPGSLTARAENYGKQWLSQNQQWMKKGGQAVSQAVIALDQMVMSRGFDPETPAYWKELSRVSRNTFPHLFHSDRPVLKKGSTAASSTQKGPKKSGDEGLPKSFLEKLDEAGFGPGTESRKKAIANYYRMKKK